MVAIPQESPLMSETDYLAYERASEIKHEYINGSVVAMTGASREHNLISSNVITRLNMQLLERLCEVYPADMRVRVRPTGLYTYPDVSIVCGEPHFTDDEFDTLLNPTVLIEVLSPSTERFDRGKKFQDYRKLPSLQEYLMISQDTPRIERYLKQDGKWVLTDVEGIDANLELPSIECTLTLTDVYRKVAFESSNNIEK